MQASSNTILRVSPSSMVRSLGLLGLLGLLTACAGGTNPLDGAFTGTAPVSNTQTGSLPLLSLSADASMIEGREGETSALTFTVALDRAIVNEISIDYIVMEASARYGEDYTVPAISDTLTFDPDITSQEIVITVLGDNEAEGAETFSVILMNLDGVALVGNARAVVTIINDDDGSTEAMTADDTLPLISVSDAEPIEYEGGISGVSTGPSTAEVALEFTVTLDRQAAQYVWARVSTNDGTATAGADYRSLQSQIVYFAAGEASKTVRVPVVADTDQEDDETVTLSIVETSTLLGVERATGTGTITDDDTLPMLTVVDSQRNPIVPGAQEPALGSEGSISFWLLLDRVPYYDINLKVSTANGTATAGIDYTPLNNTAVSFPIGWEMRYVTVDIFADFSAEGDETFQFVFSDLAGVTIISPLTATIVDRNTSSGKAPMMMWGGRPGWASQASSYQNGCVYYGETNSWGQNNTTLLNYPTVSSNTPSSRSGHTMVWTGDTGNPNTASKVLVWGGGGSISTSNSTHVLRTDGGVFAPLASQWEAPKARFGSGLSARRDHVAVWTGNTGDPATSNKMVVFGGTTEIGSSGLSLQSTDINAGIYDFATDRWTNSSWADWNDPNASFQSPEERGVSWTGAWETSGALLNDWMDSDVSGKGIHGRHGATGIWTGNTGNSATSNRMIIWGGANWNIVSNDGGMYNIAADNYDPDTMTVEDAWDYVSPAPIAARFHHAAVWTGETGNPDTANKMIVWGGASNLGSSNSFFADGAIYDPATGGWQLMASSPLVKRYGASAIWDGSRMVVWGGRISTNSAASDGAAYDPATDTWETITQPTFQLGTARADHDAVALR